MEILTAPAFLALIGTIFGGIGLKVVENLLNRGKDKTDIAAEIRKELRADVQSLRDEIRKVEAELDIWRGRYYEALEELVEIRRRLADCDDHRTEFHSKKEDDSTESTENKDL